MERGMIKSYDKESGSGLIARLGGEDVKFNATSILGRDRNSLNQGDQVFYEVESINAHHVAINIRKSG